MRIKIIGAILAIVAATFVAVALASPALVESVTIPYAGTVTTPSPPPPPSVEIGVYWDPECTSEAASVDVGEVVVGSTENTTVYVKNEGDTAVTLSMGTENWSPPEASGYITLSWDYGGQSVGPGEVVQVVLTLSVSDGISGITSFSFDLVITGSS